MHQARDNAAHLNLDPQRKFATVEDLRRVLVHLNPSGDAFLDHILEGNYFDGKTVWVNDDGPARDIYLDIVARNPHLAGESPYGAFFRRESVRVRGENPVVLANIEQAPLAYQEQVRSYRDDLSHKRILPVALFSGGPAAKIAAMIMALKNGSGLNKLDVKFVLDGAEQSNESGSASYEHINHANALNAEHDNTGLGILFLALKRALLGEKNPDAAIATGYHKVDIWPRGVYWRDLPIYLVNEIHGRLQWLKSLLHLSNDHDKSRAASKISTQVLTWLEDKADVELRLDHEIPRAVFVYFTQKHHRHSLKDEKLLARTVGLHPLKLSKAQIEHFYGAETLRNIVSADIFTENFCIRHGFDRICAGAIDRLGASYENRIRLRKIYLSATGEGTAVGVELEDLLTGRLRFQPVSHLGLSLGPTATYEFEQDFTFVHRIERALKLNAAVPYQTIATGFSAQLLFKITDKSKFKVLPYTGLKQTHFVEIGRNEDFIAIKLTSGGLIGQPIYSRSYAISAMANMLRVLTPDSGLEFYDVICAWPCTRGINGTNNGQIVRVADNFAVRFGEGGTGMSKMGTNAQTILDLVQLEHGMPPEVTLPRALYRHTIIDNRGRIKRSLRL